MNALTSLKNLPKAKLSKLFKIRGGVHPQDKKHLSADQSICPLPMPPLLHIPVQQHIGAPAEPLVKRGDTVKKGQLLARSQGAISAPIHAPTSGRIMGIGGYPANHASGLLVRTITLKPDGEDCWIDSLTPCDAPFALAREEIALRVAAAGIVGMGGATFPSSVKLNLHKRYDLHTLVINGAECEPYLTCDDRLMRECADEIIEGVRLMAYALGVQNIIFAIEKNKPQALASIADAVSNFDNIQLAALPCQYPMGSEKHLVQTLTGKETPARGLTADIGLVVHNVATAFAVHKALRFGEPLIERVVTVSGGAIVQPRNVRARIGTPLSHLIEFCGGYNRKPTRLVSGGPMMGQPTPNERVPVAKGSSGLLALTNDESAERSESPCIRCGSCVNACPCGLMPLQMAANIRAGNLDASVDMGLLDCIACGSCAFVCPANIPLVQHFNYAKGELAERQRSSHKQGETKRLVEARAERMAAIKRKKHESMLKMKRLKEQQAQAAAATQQDPQPPSTLTTPVASEPIATKTIAEKATAEEVSI